MSEMELGTVVEEEVILDTDEPETDTEATEPDEDTAESEKEPFKWEDLELKHLTESKRLADFEPDQAKTYLQKGMDYDRVKGQVESYRTNPAYQYIDNYMKQNGYTDPTEFVKALEKSTLEAEYLQQGYDEETAGIMASKDIAIKYASAKDPMADKIADLVGWHADKVKQGVFSEELTPDNIPPEVKEAIQSGASPKEAYMDWALDNIKTLTEQKTIKTIAKNKQTSTGAVASNAKESGQLSADQVVSTLERMNSAQRKEWISKNYDMVVKSGYFK